MKSSNGKGVIKSVLMIECRKENAKGTGFAIAPSNVIATNAHVVGSCRADELVGISSVSADPVTFLNIVKDQDRDLALLCARETPTFGLRLGSDEKPEVETEVETWGYPLRYEDATPILSRGYIAGYRVEQRPRNDGTSGKLVQRLIINGALNPGNSGGPLIDRTTGRVIGIVVEKWTLFSPNVDSVITALEHPGAQTGGGMPIYVTYPDGEVKSVSQQEGIRVALKEIYEKSQVMIGEAISVSELNEFIKENQQSLACQSR